MMWSCSWLVAIKYIRSYLIVTWMYNKFYLRSFADIINMIKLEMNPLNILWTCLTFFLLYFFYGNRVKQMGRMKLEIMENKSLITYLLLFLKLL